MTENSLKYVGDELGLFLKARNWKSYFSSKIKPFLKGNVLEVGAGIGGTTEVLIGENVDRWVCLEPDENLLKQIILKKEGKILPDYCCPVAGTLDSVPQDELYDAIVYIDVLEHIVDDGKELELASKLLKPKGILVVLVPAYQFLFSPFDESVGHYRRYSKNSLRKVIPDEFEMIKLMGLDSTGLLLSLANKLLLKSSSPTGKQIRFWDNVIIPVTRVTDILFNYLFGRSILGIWIRK